ncbi:hypothetical protein [Pseudomonas fluorescens]|uniref:Uncharacterized protein n=1 Tax=Pseudomonas fluorescens TaxID=294 RepID=A0A5E6QHB0_PSEFL|nr:hypothetical protein [Pseudomonas fluorescens]VVM55113.1 hypothetical protein PS655_00995 [Pseudomonas fluorescens]
MSQTTHTVFIPDRFLPARIADDSRESRGLKDERFLAVFQRQTVESKCFETVELQAKDRKQAVDEASLLWRQRDGFYTVDYTVVELDCGECRPCKPAWITCVAMAWERVLNE